MGVETVVKGALIKFSTKPSKKNLSFGAKAPKVNFLKAFVLKFVMNLPKTIGQGHCPCTWG